MSVRAKRVVKGAQLDRSAVVASDVMKSDHPLNKAFTAWLGDKQATRRQARKFLASHPHYAEVRNG